MLAILRRKYDSRPKKRQKEFGLELGLCMQWMKLRLMAFVGKRPHCDVWVMTVPRAHSVSCIETQLAVAAVGVGAAASSLHTRHLLQLQV